MTIRMGYWDCQSCGLKRNEGPRAACGGCGVARGPRVAFYTDDTAPTVEDPEMVARARAGADWSCKYCGADNRAGLMDCHQCGAGPDGAVRRPQAFAPQHGAQFGAGQHAAGQPGAGQHAAGQHAFAGAGTSAARRTPKKGPSAGLVLGIVGAVLAVVGGLVWLLFLRTTDLPATIEASTWTKTVAIEKLETVQAAAWQDEVPSGARVVKTETRGRDRTVQEGTDWVKTGQKDLGNGMFEDVYEERPRMVQKRVDDRWVTYSRDEWQKVREDTRASTDGKEPPDPWSTAPAAGLRFGAKKNELVLTLAAGGASYTHAIDLAGKNAGPIVAKYRKGERVVAHINTLGGVNGID